MKKGILAFFSSVAVGWLVAWLKGVSPIDVVVWFFTFFVSFTKACWNVITQNSEVPNWLIGCFTVLSTYTVAKIIGAIRKEDGPSKDEYTEDLFDGLVWKWRYGFDGSIQDPWCFCPECDGILVYSDDYSGDWGREQIMNLRCEHCGCRKGTLSGHRAYNVDRIRRLIDRKIRVEEWREVVAKQKAKS
jgi:hypothetical protein